MLHRVMPAYRCIVMAFAPPRVLNVLMLCIARPSREQLMLHRLLPACQRIPWHLPTTRSSMFSCFDVLVHFVEPLLRAGHAAPRRRARAPRASRGVCGGGVAWADD